MIVHVKGSAPIVTTLCMLSHARVTFRESTKPEMTSKAARKVMEDKPPVLVGSSPCTSWSTLMDLNWERMDPAKVEERKRIARIHLEFCAKLYKLQHAAGRYFLH